MLDLGFSAAARDDLGETALHTAAYEGQAQTVRLLIDRGADIDARDGRFDSTPLAFATVGSGERPNSHGDWAETVRLLLDAGAGREEVWISEKPPTPTVRSACASGPPVANVDDAGAERPRLDQLQVEFRRQRREVRGAATQHHRADEHPVLVDEVQPDQRGGESGAADGHHLFPRLRLDPVSPAAP
jgi:hypothetical protein